MRRIPMRVGWLVIAFAASVAAAQPRRSPPMTWGPLRWGQSVDQATEALAHAKLAPRYGETRGYFAVEPGQPVTHTVEPGVYFVPRRGWTGEAHFVWNAAATDYRMDRITLTALDLPPAQLATELARLEATYGKPRNKTPAQLLWVRGGTWLAASWHADPATHRAEVVIALTLRAAPAPGP